MKDKKILWILLLGILVVVLCVALSKNDKPEYIADSETGATTIEETGATIREETKGSGIKINDYLENLFSKAAQKGLSSIEIITKDPTVRKLLEEQYPSGMVSALDKLVDAYSKTYTQSYTRTAYSEQLKDSIYVCELGSKPSRDFVVSISYPKTSKDTKLYVSDIVVYEDYNIVINSNTGKYYSGYWDLKFNKDEWDEDDYTKPYLIASSNGGDGEPLRIKYMINDFLQFEYPEVLFSKEFKYDRVLVRINETGYTHTIDLETFWDAEESFIFGQEKIDFFLGLLQYDVSLLFQKDATLFSGEKRYVVKCGDDFKYAFSALYRIKTGDLPFTVIIEEG